jgi:hypothetical protein
MKSTNIRRRQAGWFKKKSELFPGFAPKIEQFLAVTITASMLVATASSGDEIPLNNSQKRPGANFQIGVANHPVIAIGLNIRDESSNLLGSIPLLSASSLVGDGTSIAATLYAITQPDESNSETVMILYQPDSTQPLMSDDIVDAVRDALTQNKWYGAKVDIRTVRPGETFPVGTQFWACLRNGSITSADNAQISLQVITEDPDAPFQPLEPR